MNKSRSNRICSLNEQMMALVGGIYGNTADEREDINN